MRRDGPKLPGWLGANFWSRTGGPLMWRSYDPAVVRSELDVLRRHRVTVTRSFFYWPDFHPEPDVIDEEKAAHFRDFLDAHAELGMSSIPTFIVGHMSGENWDPAWRGGRDLYADVWLVSRQAWFVEQMVRRCHEHPAVAGWLISNEMPIYGRRRGEPPAPTEDVTSWAHLMTQAVRAGGAPQPVSLGDGAWGIEVTGVDNGFSLRETGPFVDFVGPHVHRMDTDPVRQRLTAAFICEMAAVSGKPVVLEEFGTSSDWASGGNEHSRAYLPVEPRAASVVAVDGHGRPALLRHRNRVLCTYPLEHMAAANGRVNPEPTYRIYDALATVADVDRPVRSADPRVLAETMTHVDGRRFAWLVSQDPGEVTVPPVLSGVTLHTLAGEPVTTVTLAPYDVQVFAVR